MLGAVVACSAYLAPLLGRYTVVCSPVDAQQQLATHGAAVD